MLLKHVTSIYSQQPSTDRCSGTTLCHFLWQPCAAAQIQSLGQALPAQDSFLDRLCCAALWLVMRKSLHTLESLSEGCVMIYMEVKYKESFF